MLTIGELAQIVGLSTRTLRFYEEKGLVEPAKRDENGNRLFEERQQDWLLFVKHLRETGLSVAQVKDFRDLVAAGPTTIPQRRAILNQQATRVQEEIAAKQAQLDHIKMKLDRYDQGFNF